VVVTTVTVASGQESGCAISLDGGAPGLILYQNSIVRPTFVKDEVCLTPLSGREVEGAFPSVSRTATLVGDLTIYVLLAIFALMLMLALVVVPDSSLMLDDPISFARGG
jgi:hypothetical protein